jgi:hypothetical protein
MYNRKLRLYHLYLYYYKILLFNFLSTKNLWIKLFVFSRGYLLADTLKCQKEQRKPPLRGKQGKLPGKSSFLIPFCTLVSKLTAFKRFGLINLFGIKQDYLTVFGDPENGGRTIQKPCGASLLFLSRFAL